MEVLIVIAFVVATYFGFGKWGRRYRRWARSRQSSRDWTVVTDVAPGARSSTDTTAPAQKCILTGPAYVTDGDGLRIKKTEIRLFGVDAPEFAHPFGKKAKWALVGLCKGQNVRAEVVGEDNYGRTVAKCFLPDGRDLSAEMVKLGLALDWAKFWGGIYRKFETSDARKKLWLADARQKGRMHVWEKFEAQQKTRKGSSGHKT